MFVLKTFYLQFLAFCLQSTDLFLVVRSIDVLKFAFKLFLSPLQSFIFNDQLRYPCLILLRQNFCLDHFFLSCLRFECHKLVSQLFLLFL